MTKVNFTKEHMVELKTLYGELSFGGKVLNGKFGSNTMSPYDFLQTASLETIRATRQNLLKEIKSFEDNEDEFTTTEYSKTQTSSKRKWERFLYLLIGYKRFQAEKAGSEAKVATLRKELTALKEAAKTPAEKIKELEDALALTEKEAGEEF